MNTMNWKAIGIAVAVGIGGSMLLNVLFHVFPFDGEKHPMWAIMLISYGAAAIVDIATGTTAGWLAARRGAVHGLLAGLIVNLVSPLLGYLMVMVRERGEFPFALVPYLIAIVPGTLMGIVLATIAGAVAARISPASPPPLQGNL